MSMIKDLHVTRRAVLKGAGALVVTISVPVSAARTPARAKGGAGVKPPLKPDELDSFVKIAEDGRVTAYFGKMDMGQGVDVAIGQIVAEELDVPFERVTVVMGDTAHTVDQGGGSGSTGIQRGGVPLRNAAAEARRILLELAAIRLKTPARYLTVADGVIAVTGEAARKVSYSELIGGHYFNVKLVWNKKMGNRLVSTGKAKPKKPEQYKVVGTSAPRNDIAGKVFGTSDFITDITVPGMLHGRTVRPPKAGAAPVGVDESSIKHIPGARVVHEGDFLGVVATKEWDAVKAAETLKVAWSKVAPPFPDQKDLYDHIRRTPTLKAKLKAKDTGDVDRAFKGAARIIEAEYEWPFQSHASMGPACAIVEAKDGEATVWTGSQKPHSTAEGVAKILKLKKDQVRGIWVMGPGSYGRNDAGDGAMDAAILSKAVGRPVRIQGMRHEGTGWDPKAPASIHKVRGGFDAEGNVIAYHFHSKAFDRQNVRSRESHPSHTLAGQLTGYALKPRKIFRTPNESYRFPNKRMGWEIIPPLLERASPLRTSHFRDPLGPQVHFASESFIDEMALAVGADPVEFRLKYIKKRIDARVVKAVAEKVGWKPRVGPANKPGGTGTVAGRGIAYAQRNGAVLAIVAEVEVDRKTGRVWPRKFTIAHECGLIVNPDGLRRCIEGNIVMATSRMLWEEVMFDNDRVTSVDWETYPILESMEAPEEIDIVLIDRPNIAPKGAGEPSTRPVAGAIANAFFDATGVRLRRAPYTPERVKAALG